MIDREKAFRKYKAQIAGHLRQTPTGKPIRWLISFEDWLDLWEQSGKWDQRGKGANDYNLGRIDATGDFTKENMSVATKVERNRERFANKEKSDLQKARMSAASKGKPKSKEHAAKIAKRNSEEHGPKPLMTPKGYFASHNDAARAYQVNPAVISYRVRRYPDEYYHVPKQTEGN